MPQQFLLDHQSKPAKTYYTYGHFTTLITPLLALIVIISVVAFQLLHLTFVRATGPERTVPFPNTLAPGIAYRQAKGPADPQRHIMLSIGLRPRDQEGLTRTLQDIMRPGSPHYHLFFTPAQYATRFSPTEDTYTRLAERLQGAGFTITRTYTHRLLIDFSGTIGQAERFFHVAINSYTDPWGQSYDANSAAPQLPVSVAGDVLSINGLNTVTNWYHVEQLQPRPRGDEKPRANWCPGPGVATLTSSPLATPYTITGLHEGETVALLALNTFKTSELAAYIVCTRPNHPALHISANGANPMPVETGQSEVETDSAFILDAAPHIRTLKIYTAGNNDAGDLAAWAQIIQDAPPLVVTDWSQCEAAATPQTLVQENVLFQAAALQGQNIFAAASDTGAMRCADPLRDGVPLKQASS